MQSCLFWNKYVPGNSVPEFGFPLFWETVSDFRNCTTCYNWLISIQTKFNDIHEYSNGAHCSNGQSSMKHTIPLVNINLDYNFFTKFIISFVLKSILEVVLFFKLCLKSVCTNHWLYELCICVIVRNIKRGIISLSSYSYIADICKMCSTGKYLNMCIEHKIK